MKGNLGLSWILDRFFSAFLEAMDVGKIVCSIWERNLVDFWECQAFQALVDLSKVPETLQAIRRFFWGREAVKRKWQRCFFFFFNVDC